MPISPHTKNPASIGRIVHYCANIENVKSFQSFIPAMVVDTADGVICELTLFLKEGKLMSMEDVPHYFEGINSHFWIWPPRV